MSKSSLLVHTIDNNLDNIDVLLSASNIGQDGTDLVGHIIQEQMDMILENAELYYLEDSDYAQNKQQVFLIEFIHYLNCLITAKGTIATTSFVIPKRYKGVNINLNEETLHKITKTLNCLMIASHPNINGVKLIDLDDHIHIQINFEKKEEQGLQIK